MVELRAFLPFMGNRVPGVPEPLAVRALLDTCIQFAEETQLLTAMFGPIPTVAGTYNYTFTPPTGTTTAMVLSAWAGVRAIETVPTPDVADPTALLGPIGSETRPVGKIRALYLLSGSSVGVYPTPGPADAEPLSLRIALRPTRTATQVDDLYLDDWAEEIASGAVYRLATQPAQPWSNPVVAAEAAALFMRGMQRARVRSVKGRVVSNATIKQRPFA